MREKRDEVADKIEKILAARAEFYALFDELIPKRNGTDAFDFDAAKDTNIKDIYAKFYAYDYSVRKLLPDVYTAYDVKFNV